MSRPRDDASHVRSVHFDRGTRTLRVVLDSGSEYNYADVPEHLYDELSRSGSPDQFFRENIRDEFTGTTYAMRKDGILCFVEGRWDGGDGSDPSYVPPDEYTVTIQCTGATP